MKKGEKLKYIKSTFSYFLDKGPYLVLISIIPCLLLPFLFSPSSTLYYLCQYKTIDSSSFSALISDMRALPFDFWYLGIIGAVLVVFSVSILFGVIDKHMRTGEFNIKLSSIKSRLNFNIITTFKFLILTIIVFEVLNLLTTSLYYFWSVVFDSSTVWLIFSIFSYFITVALFFIIMVFAILWPPFMLHVGMKSKDAFKMAWRQVSGKFMSIAITLLAVCVPFQIIMFITGSCNCGIVVRTIIDGVFYAVLFPVYIALMYNVFYDVTGTERIDLKKVDIWSKKAPK